ncbi:MAG: NAD(P)/FAD-dependent oxidoreductase [Candidatus Spyradocola sp.]|jgi:NAD(P)H-nitrite reductase large subunit
MRYVIIGNSAAAIGGVEGIRRVDATSPITLLSSEPYHTYSRPLISYLLWGKTDEERMLYRPKDYYEKMGVTPLLGCTATEIDPEKKVVRLADQREIPYDKLLVATGSTPFVPPMEGLDTVEKKFSFLTLDDAHGLGAALTPQSRVLIIGAGLIGTKCAEGIRHLCRSLTIVDMAPRILPSVLDEEAATLVQRRMEAHGVTFRLSDSVARFEPNLAYLKSGEDIPFDVLVIAVGVRPRTALVEKAGGKVERGIVTDDRQRTTLPDVYAAGDCTRSHDISSGADKILAILPNAYLQGETAGRNMAGEDAPFDNAIPMNAGGFFGLHVVSAGDLNGESDILREAGSYKRLVRRDGRLVGFLLVGDVSRAGIYTALIREQTPLSTINYALIREKPQLAAFSRDERAHMLGGVKS